MAFRREMAVYRNTGNQFMRKRVKVVVDSSASFSFIFFLLTLKGFYGGDRLDALICFMFLTPAISPVVGFSRFFFIIFSLPPPIGH